MFPRLLSALLILSSLMAQEYAWPIKASKSLSATFCEYRQGHLHAGVDIKTWGEMEVPCLAISNGYIYKVIIGYNGYGRGLFFKTDEGHTAVYGHLERFNPAIENLIKQKQQEMGRYRVSLTFSPDDFPVKRGKRLAYSGTSGTEHPHLHFEIRDSLGTVLNPQSFYPGIKDTRAPIIDELMLLPDSETSRINMSRHGLVVNPDTQEDVILIQGPLKMAVNAHDRADGTYNKYNIYQAELYYNDSLAYAQSFEELPLSLSDYVELIYPGMRGKRGWRFMSLYKEPDAPKMPFATGGLHGAMHVKGLVSLGVRVTDIKGNLKTAEVMVKEQIASQWQLIQKPEHLVIVRHYPQNGYQRYQFYTSDNTYIPISQTLHTVSTTEWYLPRSDSHRGVRALSGSTGEIKWIVPPSGQKDGIFDVSWSPTGKGYFLNIVAEESYVYPLEFILRGPGGEMRGELVQTDESQAESTSIPLQMRAEADTLLLVLPNEDAVVLPLTPLYKLETAKTCALSHEENGIILSAENIGQDELYIRCDTLAGFFSGDQVIGTSIQVLGSKDSFKGMVKYGGGLSDSSTGIFKPRKKDQWRLLAKPDSLGLLQHEIADGGDYFILNDDQAPQISDRNRRNSHKRGGRLLFSIDENTGVLPYPRSGFIATLDGTNFFPDYNPLRKELSFHIPRDISMGRHTLEFNVSDQIGNQTQFTYSFSVTR